MWAWSFTPAGSKVLAKGLFCGGTNSEGEESAMGAEGFMLSPRMFCILGLTGGFGRLCARRLV